MVTLQQSISIMSNVFLPSSWGYYFMLLTKLQTATFATDEATKVLTKLISYKKQ